MPLGLAPRWFTVGKFCFYGPSIKNVPNNGDMPRLSGALTKVPHSFFIDNDRCWDAF